jgi:hypothetical protein
MNIQAEKIELIRLITDIHSEKIIKKVKSFITSQNNKTTLGNELSPVMQKRLEKSIEDVNNGKGVKIHLDDIWK